MDDLVQRIKDNLGRKNLQRDFATQPRAFSKISFTQTALTKFADDRLMRKSSGMVKNS